MDYALIFTTFGMVFMAELGDKTQLAAFCLSADCSANKLSVFLGSSAALVLSSLLAVFLGGWVGRYVPPKYIKIGAGILFIAVGLWTIFSPENKTCALN